MKDLKLGHRVKHKVDGRKGMVFGHHETTGVKDVLFPIALEGSTRKELWPIPSQNNSKRLEENSIHQKVFHSTQNNYGSMGYPSKPAFQN